MHVKYIVYYRENNPLPSVDIWKTEGDMIHSTYATLHGIIPQNISSCGDLFFNSSKKRWDLEHWQLDFGSKLKRRDKALVQKAIYQTAFLKDEKLHKQCLKLSLFRRIFQNN